MTTENSAVVKIIAQHTHEMSELQTKYKNLMEVHLATLKKYQQKSIELDEIKSYPKIVYQLGSDSEEYGKISKFLKGLERIHDGLFQAFGEGDYLHYIEEEQMKWRRLR